MAYHNICDRCGTDLDRARSYYKVSIQTCKNGSAPFLPRTKDYCSKCFSKIEELASNPNASVSYNTPGAR